MHPAEEIKGSKSKFLFNKKIVLGITGSIAAVECVKLARELIRHGADIIPVMSYSATKIIHPDSIWFATGKRPIIDITGETEHVYYCGDVEDKADLLLICPCTANTISKIAHGIDDTSVTTFATTAIGSGIPILIVPAMHISMYKHRILKQNIERCKRIGIKFIEPLIENNKAKMPEIDTIVANVIREIGKKDLQGKNILIIGGPTFEPIDDVRGITNRSSGKTAVSLSINAFYRGADVELWYGVIGKEKPPNFLRVRYFETLKDLLELIDKVDLKRFDTIVVCAAISDYIPKRYKGKIPSREEKIDIQLKPAQRVLPVIRRKAPNATIVGFKLEDREENLEEESIRLLKDNGLDFVVGNTTSAFLKDEYEILIIDKKGKKARKKGKKEELADYIITVCKDQI